ncbi:uncharacterized protein N0V89_010239 [Didymosphaeria variabile]|uniref:ACB domain-containing protein n=1 Tax=Didymosphaeria variabile TaxID=1932322 RepID=A0A9W8XFG7_9PLEO|nr:uncharacterized protein N0V89_010239 [Didymosphaeria variabile]KAJ4348860.1 hypothetical protein N0V89_010239 [Didymosphaeria variabile]
MEGDVDGIMERPDGNSEEAKRAREKWDAWKQQNGLSRTEAKRRYITTLIDTMHKFVSPSPDSRELVAELEFVWDQVKSNVPSSSSSSPLQSQTLGSMGMHIPPDYQGYASRRGDKGKARAVGLGNQQDEDDEGPLQIKSPMSQSEEDLEDEEAEAEREEEFVDAPDSQYNANSEDAAVQTNLRPQEPIPYTPSKPPQQRSFMSRLTPAITPAPAQPSRESAADKKWRARVEQALVKMTAEVAALREQLESRQLFSHSRKFLFLRFIWRIVWGSVKHIAIDIVILGLVLLWMRRNKDRRLEGAIRVLLGDAVAQVQKVGGAQLGKVKLPNLVGKKGGSS